ncbi:hypothetical protein IEQ34_015763 [Dendrobium chrysotoxum]|uniref:Uncharacterized protein n=1 Tax=Dendrobium chrysotoxum TaxID=161865 RepID=A0AAV7GGR5_DENCH|nr:hypothetical protein IEQ34_015763 [Dendrobium chrysotoxum]
MAAAVRSTAIGGSCNSSNQWQQQQQSVPQQQAISAIAAGKASFKQHTPAEQQQVNPEKQVCEKLLLGRKLEFYKWEGDAQKLLKNVRENLNKLGEHWPRIEKNKCLKEAAKSFKLSGQIVRLIILSNSQ